MKLKKMLALLLGCFLSLNVFACNAEANNDKNSSQSGNSSSDNIEDNTDTTPDKVTYNTYDSYWFPQHDYTVMPIGAYNSCPPKHGDYTINFLESEELFIAYSEAGVNTMMGLTDYVGSNVSSVLTALDYCYDYDLAYLLAYAGANDVRSESSVRSTLANVMYHDNFAGIMLCDEPGRVMYEAMANSRGIFESVLNGMEKLYHVNLFPTYANQKQLWFRSYTSSSVVPDASYSYQDYVDDYIEIYEPKVLSYDFYPITGSFPNLSNGYFENMSIIRKAAKGAEIPFWTFIQTCSFRNGQRLPTQADILWNVNTCLAYGAKGIQYFCGVNPLNGAEQFNGSMFDRSGNKTEVYDLVKTANMQIKAVDEVLMCSVNEGLILVGNTPLLSDEGDERMTIPSEDLIVNYKELSSAEGEHLLIGCFNYNGKTALYVVNNAVADEPNSTVTANDSVKLNFNDEVQGYYIKNTVNNAFNGNVLQLDVSAGEGILVVIE